MTQNRKPGRPGRPPAPPADLPEYDAEVDTAAGEDSALDDLLGLDDSNYKTTLYRFESWAGSQKNIIWQLFGVPTIEQIAQRFPGGGRFYLQVKTPTGQQHFKVIRIDPAYGGGSDYLPAAGSSAPSVSPFGSLREAIDLLGSLSEILERNRPAPQSIPEQMTGLMGSVMNMTSTVMQQAVSTQAKMVTESQREINRMRAEFSQQLEDFENSFDDEQQNENDTAENAGGDMVPMTAEEEAAAVEQELASAAVEAIGPFITKHLTDIIGAGPAGALVGIIKQQRLYRDLVKNPGALVRVKAWAEQTIPAEQAQQVFNILGI
jgi:hypothetical protein